VLNVLNGTVVGAARADRPQGRKSRFSLVYLLVLLFILLLYGNVALVFPQLDALRPAQLVAIASVLALFVEMAVLRRTFSIPSPEGYLMLAFLGAAGLSCLDALWPRMAVEALIDLAKVGVIFFLLVNTVDDERRLDGMFWVMAVGGLFPALGTLHAYSTGVLVAEERAAWIGTFGNPNELAFSLAVLVPIAFAAGEKRGLVLRGASWAMIATYLAAISVTYSRSGLLGLLAVVLVMAARYRGIAGRLMGVAILAATLVFAANYWTREEGFNDLTDDTNFNSRITTMKAGLAMFADRPLLGVGINCSIVGWPLYVPSLPHDAWLHSHNTFTQTLAETGVLGAAPYFLLIAVGLLSLRRARRTKGDLARYAAALEASICGFLVCGLANGLLLSWFPFLLLGLAAALRRIPATGALATYPQGYIGAFSPSAARAKRVAERE
jgi:O-antigen ligase